ncbi:MAG: hypothetical protein ACLRZ3_12875 [Flavonifractor plautii]
MALDENGLVIDRYGGQMDLFRNVIRCVGAPDRRFAEDALRMLRAVRFAAQLGFSIEKGTLDAIRRSARRAEKLSGERIKAELERSCSPPAGAGGELLRLGLLAHLGASRLSRPAGAPGGAAGAGAPVAGLLPPDRLSHCGPAGGAGPPPGGAPPGGRGGARPGPLRRGAGRPGAGGPGHRRGPAPPGRPHPVPPGGQYPGAAAGPGPGGAERAVGAAIFAWTGKNAVLPA